MDIDRKVIVGLTGLALLITSSCAGKRLEDTPRPPIPLHIVETDSRILYDLQVKGSDLSHYKGKYILVDSQGVPLRLLQFMCEALLAEENIAVYNSPESAQKALDASAKEGSLIVQLTDKTIGVYITNRTNMGRVV